MVNAGTYHAEVMILNETGTSAPRPGDSRSLPSIAEGIIQDPILHKKDAWIPYGVCDDHPENLREKVRESYKHRACIERISNLVAGEGLSFQAETDAAEKEAEEFFEQIGIEWIHDMLAQQIKMYGGAYPQIIFGTDIFGRSSIQEIFLPEFQTVRLGIRIKGKHKYHYYANEWKHVSNSQQNFIVDPKAYDELDFADRLYKVIRVPAYDYKAEPGTQRGTVSAMTGVWSPLQRYYPTPDYFTASAMNVINTDYELSLFDLSDIKNGLNLSYMVEIIREQLDDPKEEAKQKDADRNKVRFQLAGAENAGRAILNWVEPDPDQPGRTGIRVIPIPSGNDKGRHEILDRRTKDGILTIHGVTNPKIVAFQPEKGSSGLGNNANELIADFEMFEYTSIFPLQNPIVKFYNHLLFEAGIEASVSIVRSKPVAVKMAESLMQKVLTVDEIRAEFGFFPLEDEQREELGVGNNEEDSENIENIPTSTSEEDEEGGQNGD